MKFDFESLSSEPLVYMLMHSGAFVCVLGFIFFVIGMLFGYATWGRYKRQTRELRGEAEAMKEEIAVLKRKIGDHSVKAVAAVAMATETIHMPKKEGEPAVEPAPAAAEVPVIKPEVRLPFAPPVQSIIKEELPKAPANIIKVKAVTPAAEPAAELAANAEEKAAEKVEEKAAEKSPEAPPEVPAIANDLVSAAELPPLPARHTSPLASIIATHPASEEHEAEAPKSEIEIEPTPEVPADSVALETLPTVIELSVPPLPALDFHPDLDPKLGLIYKTRPEQIDDLTELKGISQVLQQRLYDLGIYTYAQIAAWDEDQIKEFSARLAFKDRIQREHWVEQAAQLSAKPVAV